MEKELPERIPYDIWSNSQLSIAKYYGGIQYNGKHYILDYENCKKEVRDGKEFYYPDLVLESSLSRSERKKRKK